MYIFDKFLMYKLPLHNAQAILPCNQITYTAVLLSDGIHTFYLRKRMKDLFNLEAANIHSTCWVTRKTYPHDNVVMSQ